MSLKEHRSYRSKLLALHAGKTSEPGELFKAVCKYRRLQVATSFSDPFCQRNCRELLLTHVHICNHFSMTTCAKKEFPFRWYKWTHPEFVLRCNVQMALKKDAYQPVNTPELGLPSILYLNRQLPIGKSDLDQIWDCFYFCRIKHSFLDIKFMLAVGARQYLILCFRDNITPSKKAGTDLNLHNEFLRSVNLFCAFWHKISRNDPVCQLEDGRTPWI